MTPLPHSIKRKTGYNGARPFKRGRMKQQYKNFFLTFGAILIIAYLAFNGFRKNHNEAMEQRDFLKAIAFNLAKYPDGFALGRIMPFKWEKLCVFKEYAITNRDSIETIEKRSGIELDKSFDFRTTEGLFNTDFFLLLFKTDDGYRKLYLTRNAIKMGKVPYFFSLSNGKVKGSNGMQCFLGEVYLQPNETERSNSLVFRSGDQK